MPHQQTSNNRKKWLPWLWGALIIVVLAVLWLPVSRLGADPTAIRAEIERLGPLAPVAFVLLNVAQIVVAPIPGYPVQVLGGILFGFVPGAVYTVGGMVAGGVLAAWLARRFGRPWLEKRMGAETLRHWGDAAHIDSFWTWWVILLIPLGDIPYFIAGLSRIRLGKFALAILASRGPFTLLIVWAGDSVLNWPLSWLALFMAAVGLVVIFGFSQATRIEAFARAYMSGKTAARQPPVAEISRPSDKF